MPVSNQTIYSGAGVQGFPETWQQRIYKNEPLSVEGVLGPRVSKPSPIINNKNARTNLPPIGSQQQTSPFGMWGRKLGGKNGIPLDLGVTLAGMLAESIAPNEWGGRMGGKLASLGGSIYGQRMAYERGAPERNLRDRLLKAQIKNVERDPLYRFKEVRKITEPERNLRDRLLKAQIKNAERKPLQKGDLTTNQQIQLRKGELKYVTEGIGKFKENHFGENLSDQDIALEKNRLGEEYRKAVYPNYVPDPKSKKIIGHTVITNGYHEGTPVYYNAAGQLFLDPYGEKPFYENSPKYERTSKGGVRLRYQIK